MWGGETREVTRGFSVAEQVSWKGAWRASPPLTLQRRKTRLGEGGDCPVVMQQVDDKVRI